MDALMLVAQLKFLLQSIDDFFDKKHREISANYPEPEVWESRKHSEWRQIIKPLYKDVRGAADVQQSIIDHLCTTWLKERGTLRGREPTGPCADFHDNISRANLKHFLESTDHIITNKIVPVPDKEHLEVTTWEANLVFMLDLLCNGWLEDRASAKRGEAHRQRDEKELAQT